MFIFALCLQLSNTLKTKTVNKLQKLFNANKTKETHVYLSNVQKVLDKAKARIKAHETKALVEKDYDKAHAYQMAITELAFIYSEIMLEQLKND